MCAIFVNQEPGSVATYVVFGWVCIAIPSRRGELELEHPYTMNRGLAQMMCHSIAIYGHQMAHVRSALIYV